MTARHSTDVRPASAEDSAIYKQIADGYFKAVQPLRLTKEDVLAAGGIVHRDGNIFFTNIDKLNLAIATASLPKPPVQLASAPTLQSVLADMTEDEQSLMDRDMGD
jgi:hypothetical protein